MTHRIAKYKKPRTVAAEFILPSATDIVKVIIGMSAAKLILKMSLSKNRNSRRIQYKAEDINDQLIEKIKGVDFGFQIDEVTDNNKIDHLICYDWFPDSNNIKENIYVL